MGNFDWIGGAPPAEITPFERFLKYFDWAATDFGPIEQWCSELRCSVRFMAVDTQPTIIYWGPTRTMIYNEAYVPLVGSKHPDMMGKNAPDVFPDFWSLFENVINQQALTGKTMSGEASRLLMERHGFLEETYFDWKLVPIIGDNGVMLGSYAMPSDRTKDVINERRALCVQNLAQEIATASTFDGLWKSAIRGLSADDKDVPFALLYANEGLSRLGEATSTFNLVATLGVPERHALRDTFIDLENPRGPFSSAAKEALTHSRPWTVSAYDPKVLGYLQDIDWQGSKTPSRDFAVVPVMASSKTSLIMVLGLNPHRRFNPWYQGFVCSLADTLSSQISMLRLSEEITYRAELVSKATRDFEQSEMRFSRLASRSTICVTVTNLAGRILYANSAFAKFANLDPNRVTNVDWRDIVIEEDLPLVQDRWRRVTVLKQNATFQFRAKTPFNNGEMRLPHRTGLCACYADYDEASGLETVMGLIVDISEQKWTEGLLLQRTRELENSNTRYRMLADLSPLGIVSTDREGYIQFGNDAWHDFYGFKKGQVIDAQPWLQYVCAEHLAKTKQHFVDLQTKKGPHTIEMRLNRKFSIVEGDKILENDIWVLSTGLQEYSADGEIDHIDFWVTDISAQKMAAKLLNDKMEEAIRTRTQQERFIDMISHEIRNPLSAVLHCGEEIIDSIKQCTNKSNKSLMNGPLSTASSETLLANALDAANTIMYCVQHQKQIVDDVLTLSKLDSDLLVVSPISVKLSDLMQSAAKIFEPEVRMSDIKLEMVEHESIAQHAVDWVLLDPNRFLQIVINLLTNAIKFTRGCEVKKIRIMTSVHTEPPRGLEKIDFVPRKFRPLEKRGSYVQASEDDTSQLYLRISVSDTGRGLTAQQKKMLFRRFAQASPKTSVEYGGSGLGLFISRQMTEMLGGEIGVGTSETGGCTFAFYVSTSRSQPPPAIIQPATHPGPPFRTQSAPVPLDVGPATKKHAGNTVNGIKAENTVQPGIRRVLVVEDNLVNQKVLCKQLRNRGFDVEASNHGMEALSALERAYSTNVTPFDVVLCDIEMPIMDGVECVAEVRKREEDGVFPGHIPIIGVTANVRNKHVEAAIEAGMDGVTTKPYRIDELIFNIDRLCASTTLVS